MDRLWGWRSASAPTLLAIGSWRRAFFRVSRAGHRRRPCCPISFCLQLDVRLPLPSLSWLAAPLGGALPGDGKLRCWSPHACVAVAVVFAVVADAAAVAVAVVAVAAAVVMAAVAVAAAVMVAAVAVAAAVVVVVVGAAAVIVVVAGAAAVVVARPRTRTRPREAPVSPELNGSHAFVLAVSVSWLAGLAAALSCG